MSSGETAERHLGIVGAGKAGTTFARAAIAAGYGVAISGSGPAERIALIVEVLAPGARAVSTDEAVGNADIIVLAVPMHRFRELPRDLFAGKILIDAMNYWEEIDGVDEELATAPAGTSTVVQARFPSARVVKSLNQLGYYEFETGRRPRGVAGRIAIAAAGDDRGSRCCHAVHRSTRIRCCRCRRTRSRPGAGTGWAGVRSRIRRRRIVEPPLPRRVIGLMPLRPREVQAHLWMLDCILVACEDRRSVVRELGD